MMCYVIASSLKEAKDMQRLGYGYDIVKDVRDALATLQTNKELDIVYRKSLKIYDLTEE